MYTIMQAIHGSHLYGLDTPTSDKDYKGIYLPTYKEVLLGKAPKAIGSSTGNNYSKNTASDVDTEIYSLAYFIKMACDGETICIDMLHTPDHFLLKDSDIWQEIRSLRHKFYCKDMKAFVGYAKKQASKYGIKGTRMGALESVWETCQSLDMEGHPGKLKEVVQHLPINDYCLFETTETKQGLQDFYCVLDAKYQLSITQCEFYNNIKRKWDSYGERARLAKDNQGIDWKAISHALRAAYQLEEIITTGDLLYPLKDREYLLKVKRGELDFLSDVQPELERIISHTEQLAKNSSLPSKVDVAFWDDWLYSLYLKQFGGK